MKLLFESWQKYINESSKSNNYYFVIGFGYTMRHKVEPKQIYDFVHKKILPKWVSKDLINKTKKSGHYNKFAQLGKSWTVTKLDGAERVQTSSGTTTTKPITRYEWEKNQ